MMMMGGMGGSSGGSMSMGGSSMGNMGGMNMPPMNPGMNGYIQGQGAMPDPYGMGGAASHGAGVASHGTTVGGLGNLDITSLLTGIFNFAIGIFALLVVVGLVVGAVILLKRYVFDKVIANPVAKESSLRQCARCGSTVNDGFNFCPICGEGKAVQTV